MLEKKKKINVDESPKDTNVPLHDPNVSNAAPAKVYNSFDEFFHEYALKHGVNLKWKDSVKKHLMAINCFKDQAKWLSGIKNFGL
jgi:hypothetical protein